MCLSHFLALCAHLFHSRAEVTVCSSEAYYEEFRVFNVAYHLKVRHLYVVYLCLTLARHEVVVIGGGRYCAGLVVLLQSTEYVLEALASRYCPVTCTVFRTHIRCPSAFQLLWHVWRVDGVHLREVGQAECSGTVSHVGVGQQHHGGHVLQRYL